MVVMLGSVDPGVTQAADRLLQTSVRPFWRPRNTGGLDFSAIVQKDSTDLTVPKRTGWGVPHQKNINIEGTWMFSRTVVKSDSPTDCCSFFI